MIDADILVVQFLSYVLLSNCLLTGLGQAGKKFLATVLGSSTEVALLSAAILRAIASRSRSALIPLKLSQDCFDSSKHNI